MRLLALVVPGLCLLGCPKSKTEPETPPSALAVKKAERASGKAEVEFFGTWSAGEVKAVKVMFVAQVEPCTPVPEKPTRFGEAKLDTAGPLFGEFFIPQGAKGHACVYGYDDAGRVVGVADSTQNPMTFEGSGEVMFAKLEFTLRAR